MHFAITIHGSLLQALGDEVTLFGAFISPWVCAPTACTLLASPLFLSTCHKATLPSAAEERTH